MSDWIKILNSLPAHPKILRAGDRAAWLYVCGLCYSNEHLTDGHIPREVLMVAAPGIKAPEKLAEKLVEIGLWHEAEGGWVVHDYGDHQRTAAQVKETRRKDRERKARKESTDTFPKTRKESTDTFPPDSARNPNGIPKDSSGAPKRIPSETYADARSQEKKREEVTPHSPLSVECEEWLLHYEQTTGHKLPKRTTKAFAAITESYGARRKEGYTPDDLKLATVGAHSDPYRREHGYDTAESVLTRPTKIASLVAKGKLRTGNAAVSSAELGERLRGGAA